MKKIGVVSAIIVGIVLIFTAGLYLTEKTPQESAEGQQTNAVQEKEDLAKTKKFLSEEKVLDALEIIHNYESKVSLSTPEGRQWLNLFIDAAIQSRNFEQLVLLYEIFPQAFNNNESTSILVANGYILLKQPQKYLEIRNAWKDHATMEETWVVMDADELILEGKKEQAIGLLQSHKYEGRKDAERLIHLALYELSENPALAWDYLNQALKLNPKNTYVLSYKGKMLEAIGQDALAQYEYQAAIQMEPENILLRDQLAEFYLRHNQPRLALTLWLDTFAKPSLDLIWLKALFWSKVVMPVDFEWSKAYPPIGQNKDLINYLISLPKGVFWEKETFDDLPKASYYLTNIPLTFWLRLLQALKDKNEQEAFRLLRFNKFVQSSMDPQLEKAVKQVLSYRLSGSFLENTISQPTPDQANINSVTAISEQKTQSFFDILNVYVNQEQEDKTNFALPYDFETILKSPEIYSILLLQAKWWEAALELHQMDVLPDAFPNWIAMDLTQAYRLNRSSKEALAFAVKQKKTPDLSVLIGELYIAENNLEEALKVLLPYTKEQSPIGVRASYLASLVYINEKEYSKATDLIKGQPDLANDTLGQEMFARIALLQGDKELAAKLYTQIETVSPEAKSYLARRAFENKEWARAEELTEQLLLIYPNSPVLIENLANIKKREQEKK